MLKIKSVVIFFLFLKICTAFDIPRNSCQSDLYINKNHYNIKDIYDVGDSKPTDAHFDKFGNLFFVKCGRNEDGYHFNVYLVKFDSTVSEKIPGLSANVGYSVAVDRKNSKVYFGTEHGIYKYDYEAQYAKQVSARNLRLDMIVIDEDGNKYITVPKDGVQELFLLNEEKKIPFNSLKALQELTIDDNNNFYYIKEKQLFVLKSTLSTPLFLGNVSHNGMAQIAVHNASLFVANGDLLYIHENETGNLKVIDNTPNNLTAIAFDITGNFILGVPGKIFKYIKKEYPSKT